MLCRRCLQLTLGPFSRSSQAEQLVMRTTVRYRATDSGGSCRGNRRPGWGCWEISRFICGGRVVPDVTCCWWVRKPWEVKLSFILLALFHLLKTCVMLVAICQSSPGIHGNISFLKIKLKALRPPVMCWCLQWTSALCCRSLINDL